MDTSRGVFGWNSFRYILLIRIISFRIDVAIDMHEKNQILYSKGENLISLKKPIIAIENVANNSEQPFSANKRIHFHGKYFILISFFD